MQESRNGIFPYSAHHGCAIQAAPWHLNVVEAVIGRGMNSRRLADALDFPGFTVPTSEAFVRLMRMWYTATGDLRFPLPALLSKPWRNRAGQLALLRWATQQSVICIDFTPMSPHRLEVKVSCCRLSSCTFYTEGGGAWHFCTLEMLPWVQWGWCCLHCPLLKCMLQYVLRAVS